MTEPRWARVGRNATRAIRVRAAWARRHLRPRTRWREWRRRQRRGAPLWRGWPADFNEWVRRSRGRHAGAFPDEWRSREDLPIANPSRLGVVVHVFYPELLDELLDRIRMIPVDYDLLITTVANEPIVLPSDMGLLRNARIFGMKNRGRDILPLVSLVNAGLLDPYELVLKVHTKRSAWRATHGAFAGDGEQWRTGLIDALLGDPSSVKRVLSAFAEQSDLGLVTADGSVLGAEYWGDNQAHVANLLRRLELEMEPSKLRFAAGSMYWVRAFALQGLKAFDLTSADFEPEEGQVNLTTAHAIERVLGFVLTEAGLSLAACSALGEPSTADRWRRFGADGEPVQSRARIVPFYLPQFHPIPENDRWWGNGFTEWTNVTAARPVYRGHYQPRLPRTLGFYDLRLDEVRRAQYTMSTDHGIEGFMYYYYWFAGKRLLDAPLEALLKSDLPQPFCIMWANENWTRRWDGRDDDVLIAQDSAPASAHGFIDDILPFLSDDRYMTIAGRRIVAIYRPGLITDLKQVIATWRQRARAEGLGELFVMNVDVHREFHGLEGTLADHGLDASLGFPPHNHLFRWRSLDDLDVDRRFHGNILSYEELVRGAERRLRSGLAPNMYPGSMVAFDNTPRRQWTSDMWYGSNPYTFRRWLESAVQAVRDRDPDQRMVFINAWNEWAEAAALEPNDRFGLTYLLAVRDVAAG